MLSVENKWVLMSKDRHWIVKGTVQGRHLVPMMDSRDKKRILTYNDSGTAMTAAKIGRFNVKNPPWGEYRNQDAWIAQNLEPVPVLITMEEMEQQ